MQILVSMPTSAWTAIEQGDSRDRVGSLPPGRDGPFERVETALTFSPRHRIAFAGSDEIAAATFSPDGRTLYCAIDGESIDLWAAGVSIWPEMLGSIAALVLIAWVLVFSRVRRRAQIPGAPHCRRCNYNVTGQAPDAPGAKSRRVRPPLGAVCPECGTDLGVRPPRRGRSAPRRLWLPTAIMLMTVSGYGALHLLRIPRTGPPARWGQVWLEVVDNLAERHQIAWLNAHRVRVFRILSVDTATGRVVGPLCTRRGRIATNMLTSPDGRHLAFGENGQRAVWLSTRTGRASATISAGGEFRPGLNDRLMLGLDGPAAEPEAWFIVVDQEQSLSRIVRWNPRTGGTKVMLEEKAYRHTAPRGSITFARRAALRRSPGGTAIVTWPDFMALGQGAAPTLMVYDESMKLTRSFDLAGRFVALSDLHVTPDGRRLFVSGMHDGIFGYDLETGESLGTVGAGAFETPDENMRLSADGRFIFTSVHRQSVLVRDTHTQRWVARLNYPEPFIAPKLVASPDGKWLAAMPFQSFDHGTPRARYVRELFLFDLSPMYEAADGPTEPR